MLDCTPPRRSRPVTVKDYKRCDLSAVVLTVQGQLWPYGLMDLLGLFQSNDWRTAVPIMQSLTVASLSITPHSLVLTALQTSPLTSLVAVSCSVVCPASSSCAH